MSRRFSHTFKIVAIVHLAVVLLLVIGSGWRRFFRPKPRLLMPIELMVEVPSVEEALEAPVNHVPVPKPQEDPLPLPRPEPKPEPKKKRKPIKKSTRRITKTPDASPRKKTLSEEEIRKLLERGVPAGDHTNLPDDDTLSLEMIRLAFYNSWEQPSREEADGKVVRVEITFGVGGRLDGRRILHQSGVAVLDASVVGALKTVTRVNGLTSDFLGRTPVVTIAFEVE